MKKIFLLLVSVFMIGCMAYGENGQVVHVTKSEFIEKVYDYEKIRISGYIKERSRQLSIFMPTGAALAADCRLYWRNWRKNIKTRL